MRSRRKGWRRGIAIRAWRRLTGNSPKPLLPQRPELGDDFKIAVAMKQQHIVINRELCDATVDRAPHCFAQPPKVKKDPRGAGPQIGTGLEVILNTQVFVKQVPFAFIPSALQ